MIPKSGFVESSTNGYIYIYKKATPAINCEFLKGQSHEMFKALFKYGLIGLGQERNR